MQHCSRYEARKGVGVDLDQAFPRSFVGAWGAFEARHEGQVGEKGDQKPKCEHQEENEHYALQGTVRICYRGVKNVGAHSTEALYHSINQLSVKSCLARSYTEAKLSSEHLDQVTHHEHLDNECNHYPECAIHLIGRAGGTLFVALW